MYSEYDTNDVRYLLKTAPFVCNRFGLAEFFAKNYECFGNSEGVRALDVGCGALPLGIFLADQKRCKVVGVELNPIAYKCAWKNLEMLKLNDSIELIRENFAVYSEWYDGPKFDLIVANPPINDKISKEDIIKYAGDTFERIDGTKYSYLTNSWHSSEGKDLLDYIFEFGARNLKLDGRILIVFCTIDFSSPDFVYQKAEVNEFVLSKKIEGHILSDSIGVKTFAMEQANIYMAEFRRR